MAKSLDSLSSYYIEDEPIVMEELGRGAYAVVKKIMIYETECAAKIVYEDLITDDNLSQFKRVLKLQATLRHPNITQFIGFCRLEESSRDVLIMELMHSNLHEFLSKPDMQNNIPLSRKKSILEDVARGLLYLHRKDIVHRDLTAKNVLLTSALVAKIADLGTSRMVPKQVELQRSLMTKYPGTTVYMPPEADREDYDPKKLDIFSFGHLTLFILIQVFPAELPGPTFTVPVGVTSEVRARTEVERRETYFAQLEERIPNGQNHPLTLMAKQCLDNVPSSRPEVASILHTLRKIDFDTEDYENKHLNVIEAFTLLAHKKKDELQKQHELILQQKEAEIEALRKRLGDIPISPDDPTPNPDPIPGADIFRQVIAGQEWPAPNFPMHHPKAVTIDDHIYMGGGYASEHAATVLEMELQSGKWNEIKNCPMKYFGMTVVKNELYVVGGVSTSGSRTGDVYTLDMTSKEWSVFPCAPMKEKRSTMSVVTYADKWLFAIGGETSSGSPLDSIERLNTEDPEDQRRWILCPKLPSKCAQLSSTVVGNNLFVFVTKAIIASSMEVPSNRVYCGRLDVLVYSDESYRDFSWQEISGVPSKSSTPLSYDGSLLALGGFESECAPTSCIYKLEYHPTAEGKSPQTVWKKIDNLPHPLYQCAATKITDQIFVYGMRHDSKSATIHHVYLHTLNEN